MKRAIGSIGSINFLTNQGLLIHSLFQYQDNFLGFSSNEVSRSFQHPVRLRKITEIPSVF